MHFHASHFCLHTYYSHTYTGSQAQRVLMSAFLTKSVETDSKNFTSFQREQAGRARDVKERMDTLQQNCMDHAGRELQKSGMDSKFRHELEKIRNNESGKRTKFQVEIERNLETKLLE